MIMKNIQVIDAAENCLHSIFEVSNSDFNLIFHASGQDIEFSDDLYERLVEQGEISFYKRLWDKPIDKKRANGIHGTIFYDLAFKKKYYPTKKESEMVVIL
jgi:hypothetical protein